MRTPIIVGNWKMNKTIAETEEFLKEIDPYIEGITSAQYGIATPYTDLYVAVKNSKNLVIGAENCHFEDNGAFTGEVSIPMLKEIGIASCIIGHSERRQMFNETDEAVNLKVKKLLANDIMPIMCCGETEAEFDAGKTEERIRSQVSLGLAGLDAEDVKKVVVAYEPIWAIGTGKVATPAQAEEVHAILRKWLRDNVSAAVADKVRIIYGGSVSTKNCADLIAKEDIDGFLVGGASLKPDFVNIINC